MRCPFCGHDDTNVRDSRPAEDNASIRRRRFCPGASSLPAPPTSSRNSRSPDVSCNWMPPSPSSTKYHLLILDDLGGPLSKPLAPTPLPEGLSRALERLGHGIVDRAGLPKGGERG